MRKNFQLHLVIETELSDILKRQAKEANLTLSEYCRQRLRENSQLTKLEILLEKLDKKFSERRL